MSAEIVEGPDGLYVITGDQATGYYVHPVGEPVAVYKRKVVARQDVRSGAVLAAESGEAAR